MPKIKEGWHDMVKILVTRQIPDRFIEQLEQFGDVKMWKEAFEPMPREQF